MVDPFRKIGKKGSFDRAFRKAVKDGAKEGEKRRREKEREEKREEKERKRQEKERGKGGGEDEQVVPIESDNEVKHYLWMIFFIFCGIAFGVVELGWVEIFNPEGEFAEYVIIKGIVVLALSTALTVGFYDIILNIVRGVLGLAVLTFIIVIITKIYENATIEREINIERKHNTTPSSDPSEPVPHMEGFYESGVDTEKEPQ